MNTRVYEVGPSESVVLLPQRMGQVLTPNQQRVLELKGGDSFVLQRSQLRKTMASLRSGVASARHRCSPVELARGPRVRLAYRMVGKDAVRIWRFGVI